MKVPFLFRDMTSLIRWTSGRKTVLYIFTVDGLYQVTKYTCINNESTDSIQGHDKFNEMDFW